MNAPHTGRVSHEVPAVPVTAAKAYVAAIGATLTALTTALGVVSVAVGNDAVDASEMGAIVTAVVTLCATVWGVWRVPNQPVV
jgi:hypothetical protein